MRYRSLWSVPIPSSCLWNWHKILKLREIAYPFISCKLGNGESISFWFDNWTTLGPLRSRFSNGFQSRPSIEHQPTVSVVYGNMSWHWPRCMDSSSSNVIAIIQTSVTHVNSDIFCWSHRPKFMITATWKDIKTNTPYFSGTKFFGSPAIFHESLLFVSLHF